MTHPTTVTRPDPLGFATEVLERFVRHDCLQMSAALAYYTMFSVAPLVVVVMVVVGLFVSPEVASRAVGEQLLTLVGSDGAAQILIMAEHVHTDRGGSLVARALGVALAGFGATGVLVQLQAALDRIWEVPPDPSRRGARHFLRRRLVSFAMILAIAFVLLVSLALTAFLTLVAGSVATLLPWRSVAVLRLVDSGVSLLVVTTLFATMFRFLPETHLRWRQVWPGAAVTGGLFTVGKLVIGLILARSDLLSAYGAASSLAVVLVWVYYSSVILLLGAEFTVVWSQRQRRTPGGRPPSAQRLLAQRVAADNTTPSHIATATRNTKTRRSKPRLPSPCHSDAVLFRVYGDTARYTAPEATTHGSGSCGHDHKIEVTTSAPSAPPVVTSRSTSSRETRRSWPLYQRISAVAGASPPDARARPSRNASRSAIIATASGYRRSRSGAIACRITAASAAGTAWPGSATSPASTRSRIRSPVVSSMGALPVSRVNSSPPRAYTSTRGSRSTSPRSCSGAAYCGDPAKRPGVGW